MKKSNIIITASVLLTIGWLFLSGWLMANALNTIKSTGSCSYAEIKNYQKSKKLQPFKNIKIDFATTEVAPNIAIQYGTSWEINIAELLTNYVDCKVKNDTLYLKIEFNRRLGNELIVIKVPEINNVALLSSKNLKASTNASFHGVKISGFKSKALSVKNNCAFNLTFENNTIEKLSLTSSYSLVGKTQISDLASIDSLDVDIQSKSGELMLVPRNAVINENPKQWVSIKVPETFRVDVLASMMGKITVKK